MNDRRRHLVLLGCILAALVGVAFLAVPSSPVHKKLTLGLDLQGGLEVVLKAVPPKGHQLTKEDLSRSIDIMRQRIDKLGVSEPEIRQQGSNQIVIQLAGIHDPGKAAELIGKTAVLEFYDFEADLTALGQRPCRACSRGVSQPFRSALGPTDSRTRQQGHGVAVVPLRLEERGAGRSYADEEAVARESGRAEAVVRRRPREARPQGLDDPHRPREHGGRQLRCRERQLPEQPAADVEDRLLPVEAQRQPEQPIPEMTGRDLKLSGTRADIDTRRTNRSC